MEHNSYASSDAVNSIKWNSLDDPDTRNTYNYYRGLLKLRKEHDVLRLATREEVLENITPLHVDNPHVVAFGIGSRNEHQMISIFNGGYEPVNLNLPQGKWGVVVNAEKAGVEPFAVLERRIHVEGISAMILVKMA